MIDANTRDLINEALDGELPPTVRTELDALLASSEEARTYYDEMRELGELLQQTPSLEPPAGLKSSILARARLPQARAGSGFSLAGWLRGLPQPAMLFLTFAAGALLATAVLGIATNARIAIDPDQLVGTMAGAQESDPRNAAARLWVTGEQVAGLATVAAADGLLIVSFSLQTDQPIEIAISQPGQPMQFRGFTRAGQSASLTHQSPDRITVEMAGESRFALALVAPEEQGDARFRVDIRANGLSVFSGALEPSR